MLSIKPYTIQKITTPHFEIEKEAVMTPLQRGIFLVLVSSAFILSMRYFIWWVNPSHIPNNTFSSLGLPVLEFNIILFLLLTFVVHIGFFIRFVNWFALWHMAKPKSMNIQKNLNVAFITCYVPEKEPIDMLIRTLKAMQSVSYPHDTWVLDEGNSDEVKRLCVDLGVKHFSRKGILKYNQSHGKYTGKTKGGNLNSWRDNYEKYYDIVAQIDMDHVPKVSYFKRTLGYFNDPKVAFVGIPQVYKNTENWIARGAAEQSYFFYGPIQQGFFGCDMPFLIGTSHIYRTEAMQDIGGYASNIAEDHLTGMYFFANGWKGVYVPEILAEGEGPLNWVDYFNQQMRWSYGLFEILVKHTPRKIHKLRWKHKLNFFFMQLFYFTGVAVVLGNLLVLLYLAFGINAANMQVIDWTWYALPPLVLFGLIRLFVVQFQSIPEKPVLLGLTGMVLGVGANIIYAIAFYKFITGRKLTYAVTKKGTSGERQVVPLRVFRTHVIIGLLMVAALVFNFTSSYTSVIPRFWGLVTAFSLLAVSLSIYAPRIRELFQSSKDIGRFRIRYFGEFI